LPVYSGNLNILSEARIHAPELISDQVSVARRQVGWLFDLADLGPQAIGTAATLRSIF
jgi:hypothetical protein